ncbi:MAG: universal stress protein [Actinocrinis sp.]
MTEIATPPRPIKPDARTRIAHIAVAYDDSAGAHAALAQAIALMRVLPHATLTVIAIDEPEHPSGQQQHVAGHTGADAHCRDWARKASEYAHEQSIDLTTDVRTGHAAGQILIAARAAHADLLVIGHGRHPELHNRVLGSTAEHVARHAFCSVLIAH